MRRLVVFLLVFAVAACATVRKPPPPIAEQMAALQKRLFLIVEEKRHRLEPRATPLMLDPQLSAAAQKHADAMAKAHAMDSKGSDENPAIQALMGDPKFQGFVAENVGQQFYDPKFGIDVDTFAQAFLDVWLKGKEHVWNISFRGFNRTGIGVATDGKAIFVSQLFSTDFGLPPPPDPPGPEAPEKPPAPQPKPDAAS
jgi:uncharacterized protein YkwD